MLENLRIHGILRALGRLAPDLGHGEADPVEGALRPAVAVISTFAIVVEWLPIPELRRVVKGTGQGLQVRE